MAADRTSTDVARSCAITVGSNRMPAPSSRVAFASSSSNPGVPSPTRLCQTQYDSKDQESEVHTLGRVDDDAHPGAAEVPAWKCI